MNKKQESDGIETTSRFGWKSTLLICVLIFGAAALLYWVIFSTEPKATREGATRESAMPVSTVEVVRQDWQAEIVVMGAVMPAQEIMLSPRVEGTILERSPEFSPGATVKEGDILLRVDPSDYENALKQRQSELLTAEASLEQERGRQDAARKDFELLDRDLNASNRALVLREPQLKAAQAAVDSARAAVRQAELNLERTSITAPFDALVLERDVNVGSRVSPSTQLGRLVGTDVYWVEATVPLSQLEWIDVPGPARGETGAEVLIRSQTAWPDGVVRTGTVYRLVGALDDRTRMARILVNVEDPLGLGATKKPQLIVGAYVEASIKTRPFPNVVRINRDYVHQNDTVWVNQEGKLDIRDVHVLYRDAEYAYVDEGLQDGDDVVTTRLATVKPGAALRLIREDESGEGSP